MESQNNQSINTCQEPLIRRFTPSEYRKSIWSGGSTTELSIAPAGASYEDRSFLWRLSSATVDLEESEFTPLPDYYRLITPLTGTMTLSHNNKTPVTLSPFEIHAFDGASRTCSEGRCTDFNLMLRKGKCEGSISLLRTQKTENPVHIFPDETDPCEPDSQSRLLNSDTTVLLFCVKGQALLHAEKICAGFGEPENHAFKPVPVSQGETIMLQHAGSYGAMLESSADCVFMKVTIRTFWNAASAHHEQAAPR